MESRESTMLIILEGPDLAGKSTLAGLVTVQLASRYRGSRVELLHRSPPKQHPLDEYVTPLLGYDPRGDTHIVCDRWHIGESIYPIVKNRPSAMSPGVKTYVDKFLESRGAMVMVINPEREVLLKRLSDRGDPLVTEVELIQLNDLFATVTERLERYVTFTPTVDTVLASAVGTAKRVTPTPWVTYVGPRVPSILLVGDERNCRGEDCEHDRPRHSPLGPAFMPYPATSGAFLMNAVKSVMNDFGVANACDVDDILGMWRELYQPRVVALGVKASEKLHDLGIPHGTVPHPKFIRRFYHRKGMRYAAQIAVVAESQEDAISWRP
jgi:hypothetical protein